MAKDKSSVWYDRKRTFLGLPWSFTRYSLNNDTLSITTGILSTKEEEIRLYRIIDLTLTRSLGERILGLGSIHVCSSDNTCPEADILHIKDSKAVRDLLSDMVEKARREKGEYFITTGEAAHPGRHPGVVPVGPRKN
ncbi:MAG: PH domain-containing protein [Oscillospiraceae bacterium]|nr:PH domain-containing protein [Oscillospiraceae bacterium]